MPNKNPIPDSDNIQQIVREATGQDVRLKILQILACNSDLQVNQSVLFATLDTLGYFLTKDFMANQLLWLEEQAFIKATNTQINFLAITDSGKDVATGKVKREGVGLNR